MKTADLVVIDDIGLKEVTDSTYELLYDILEFRGSRPTIFTSNKSPSELNQIYDARIMSRLGRGRFINVVGPDQRLQKGDRQ